MAFRFAFIRRTEQPATCNKNEEEVMPFYHSLGKIPHKRHTQFNKPEGGLYREELMGLEGFSSLSSLLYHNFLPPRVKKVEDLGPTRPEYSEFGPIRHRPSTAAGLPAGGDAVAAVHCWGIPMSSSG
jgi:homogentisate 1,2-dioxygenase